MRIPLLICTVSFPGIAVLKTSIDTYAKDSVEPIIVVNQETTFGEAYNAALTELFKIHEEVLIANDDIVLLPDSIKLLLEDITTLKTSTEKLGFIAARSDNVRPLQQGRSDKTQEVQVISPLLAYLSKAAFTDAQFPPINYWSDDVLCLDLNQKGYKHYISRSYVQHVGSQTTAINPTLEKDKAWLIENRPDILKTRNRRVIIGTPTYDGRVDVLYAHALVETIKLIGGAVEIYPIFIAYDALIQRARNDIIKLAIEADVDDLVFIDADQGWKPSDILQLLNHNVDIVGGTVPKKSDEVAFNIKRLPDLLTINEQGLLEVECVGTGFLRLTKRVMQAVWDTSIPYAEENKTNRMVFDIQIIDGQLISEDNIFCKKCRSLGFTVYIDPTINCDHIGVKKYTANFLDFIRGH